MPRATTINTNDSDVIETEVFSVADTPSAWESTETLVTGDAWKIAEATAPEILGIKDNSVYSPACIYEGLRVIRLGSDGKTAEELDTLLNVETAHGDWLGLKSESEWAYEEYVAHMASGVWLDEKANPSNEFIAACERDDISVTTSRLSETGAGNEIARWIHEKTEGLLSPNIDLNPQTLACVASALYLKDAWMYEFFDDLTERKPFHADDVDIDADYMVKEAKMPFTESNVGTLVGCPLSNGASMVLLLPKEECSLDEILRNGSAVTAIANFSPTYADIELHLPKFTCETTVTEMAEVLKKAGFATADKPDLYPMTGVGVTPAEYVHGAKIAIDENGLEAGAYFAMVACAGIPRETLEPPVPRVVVLDRPFVYAVVSRTGQPLFVGAVRRPEADSLLGSPFHSDDKGGEYRSEMAGSSKPRRYHGHVG